MINLIYRGIRRLFFGPTSVFAVRSGAGAFNGSSFVPLYHERAQYPLRIVGIQFQCDPEAQGEWRICVAGVGKVFPYNDVNSLDSDYHSLIPIEVAAGELFCVEARSRNADYKGIIILQELDVCELR